MMDRGREARRSGAERGGPVSAPRRPRTSGFKDASVGEDCDETMDDVHNPRLRERPKKDSNSLMPSGKGLVSSSVASIPRFKRKRQGLHEIQEQVRGGSIADEGEDTTHDSELGGSEDDDDLPPPTIPRRPSKSRPQLGKGVDEMSIRNDLPTVPRKARSAVPKRAQESPPPPPAVAEIPPAQPTPPIASPTPAPSSTLSSSSAVTLKPRRRTKPSGSKPKVPKLLKVSTPTVSEEVEVAEALFDLARTIPPPTLDKRTDLKPEPKPEAKSLPSASVQAVSTAAQPSNGTAVSSPMPPLNNSLTVPTGPPPAATPASPVLPPSPSSTAAPPPAEAPKRKRPRVRTRPEEGAPAAQASVLANSVVVNSSIPVAAAPPPIREVDQSEDHPLAIKEEGSLKTEAATTVPVSGPAPASSSISGSLPVAAPSMQQNSTVERKHEKAEKKIAKGEVTKTTSNEKKASSAPPVDVKPTLVKLAGPTTGIQEVDATVSSPLPDDSPNKKDVAKRSAQPAPAADDGRLNNFNIDLMALSSKASLPLSSERNDNVTGTRSEVAQEKPLVDVSVTSPVVSGWIETAKEEVREQEPQGREETETEMPKEQESDKERERAELSKLPPQRASKSVKTESRPQKSEKPSSTAGTSVASSLLASTVASPLSTGMPPGWPGVMPPLGYFPAAAGWPAAPHTGASSADENPQPRVSPFSNMPPQQPWKRCSCHVWIAHYINRQQQANRRPFFAAELYGGKSYNPNMPLTPADSLYGSSGGGAQVAAVAGPSMSSVALGAVLGVGERVLGGTTVSGVKERDRIAAATFVDVLNQNSASQQQPPSLSLQAGTAFGYSGTQAGTVAMASSGPSAGVVNGVAAAANMGSTPLTGSISGPGTNSLAAVSLGSTVGPGMVASNRVAVSGASVQEHYMHAMMQNPFPYHHYPGHFGPPAFNGPPTHIGTQQAAAQYFAGAPFFGPHLVPPSQQTSAHQTSVASSGGSVPSQKQQQQPGVRRYAPTGSPHSQQLPPQSPSPSSSLQQLQPQSDRDGRDGTAGGDAGSVPESKFPILHRPPYSQGCSNAPHSNVTVAPPSSQTLSSHQDFSMFPALGKQSNQREQQQQQQHISALQLQASQSQPSLSSQLQQQQQQAHLQISLKGLDPQASQAFSAMTMAAAMNRGPVGPGPLGLAPVAAVMAPQGHAMLQSMADAVRHPPQSPHHASGSGTPHQSLMQQQQQQQRMQHRQQQQQHRSVQMQRGPMAVDEGHIVAEVSNYPTNTGGGRERDPGDDRKMSSKQPIGMSSPIQTRVNLDGSPTRGNTRNVAPTLNLSASTSSILSTRPTGQVAQSGVPPSVAQASHAPRQSVRSKGITGSNTASSAASNQSNMVSYADRGPLAAASLTAKASGPGLSLPGQTAIPPSQGARQTPIAQHSHLKLPQRTAMGSTPTAPGTDPKAVLAAAMAKVQNTQNPLQQSRSPQVAPRSGSPSQMSSAVSGPPASSSPAPLSPLAAGSKPSWSVGAKQGSSTKGSASFPTTQKSVGAASGKRNSSPSLSQHVILGASPALGNQNLSAKLTQQQQQLAAQNSHAPPQQPQAPQQHAPPLQQQYPQASQTHKQQNSQQQQPQPLLVRQQRQLFQQQQVQMFQQQQLPHSQSPPLPSTAPQHPQQLQQQPQHAPLTQAQLQQNLSHQRPVQHLSQQQQQPVSSLPGSVPNGVHSLASGAMLGSSNSSNVANASRNSGAENIGVSQATNTRPAPSNFSASPLPGPGSLRGSSPSPAYLHPQFSASQELNSPEQPNSMRPLQVSASVKTSTSLSAASPSSSIPQPLSVRPMGAANQGKSSSGQFTGSNHGDNMLPRNSLMQLTPSSTVNSSPNHSPNNSISNGHSGSNVQPPPLFAGSSAAVQQGTVNSSQMHPPSSLSMVAASVVPTGPASAVEP